MGSIFGRSLIDLIEKEVPSWFGVWGSVSMLEVSELELFWMWECEATLCNWQWWKQFVLWRAKLCSPSCLGHLLLLQCGLGSYGERNSITVNRLHIWSKVVETKSKVCRSLWRA